MTSEEIAAKLDELGYLFNNAPDTEVFALAAAEIRRLVAELAELRRIGYRTVSQLENYAKSSRPTISQDLTTQGILERHPEIRGGFETWTASLRFRLEGVEVGIDAEPMGRWSSTNELFRITMLVTGYAQPWRIYTQPWRGYTILDDTCLRSRTSLTEVVFRSLESLHERAIIAISSNREFRG